MKRSLLPLTCFFLALTLPNYLIAQCNSGSGSCSGAPLECLPISGQLADVPPAGATFPGCPSNSLDNPSWHAFEVNSAGLVTVTVTPSNCQGTGSGGAFGAQYGWYADCSANSQNFGVQCACTGSSGSFSATVGAGIYYVMVDGCAADVCDYTIDVVGDVGGPPVTQPNDPNVFPSDPCPGETVQICTDPIAAADTYIWSFPPGVIPLGSPPYCECVDVIWGSNSGAVTVTVLNNCSPPETSNPTIVDVPSYNVTDGGEYCFPDEPGWFHPGTNIYWPGGTHTLNLITTRGCDSIVTINVIERTSQPHQAFEQICLGDFTCPIGGQIFNAPTSTTIILDNASAFGCDSTINVVVDVIAPILTLDFPDTLDCENLATGGVLVQANGQSNATYSWWTSDGEICDQITDRLIFACLPGWYHVEVVMQGQAGTECGIAPYCVLQDSIEVIANIDNPILAMDSTDVSCGGQSDGAASVSIVSGGATPFSYNWSVSAGNTSSISNLPAGTYTVTVSGGNGCSSVDSVTITEPDAVLLALVGTTDASCNGGLDGSATVSASGGTPGYTYAWPGGQTGTTATSLASGTYLVTATDNNGCSATLSVVVSEPSTMSIAPTAMDVSCNGGTDGSASVTASGGTPPYAYAWSHDGTNSTSSATNLTAGDYSITITDDSGCNEIRSITVNEPTPVTASATASDVSCNGDSDGSASITANGGSPGYSYSWPGGQTTATVNNLASGTYNVVVSDLNNCTAEVIVVINEPQAIAMSELSTQDVSCNGNSDGQASVSASGGTTPFSYSWSGGQIGPNATDLPAGSHTVVVTDGNGCTASLNVQINEPPVLNLTEDASADASCFGISDGSATVSANGGVSPYSFSWSGGQSGATVNNLSAGTHTVVVTDDNGCTEEISILINQPPILTLIEVNTTDASCDGATDGSATVEGNGGSAPYSYSWPGGQSGSTVNNLAAGTYDVTVTDDSGCTNELTVSIDQPTDLALAELNSDDALCNGDSNGSAAVEASGGTSPYTFNWSTGNTGANVGNLPVGTHTVTVTDDNGCTEEIDVVIDEPPALNIAEDNVIDALCEGSSDGEADVSANGGTPPYDFEWSDGQTGASANNLAAGSHTVTVTDDNGCTEELEILIGEPAALVLTEDSVTDILCNGESNGSASVSASGGTGPYDFEWSNGDNGATSNSLAAGSHTVTVTDDNGCTEEISVSINEPPALSLVEVSTADASCDGAADGSATVEGNGGTPPYSFDWPGGQSGVTVNDLAAGSYDVTITDDSGCTEELTISIDEPAAMDLVEVNSTDALCNGESSGSAEVEAGGGTSPYTYDWSSGNSGATASNLPAGTHMVTATDDNGCTQEIDIVIDEPTVLNIAEDNVIDALCEGNSDGEAEVSASGGTSPYDFEWSNGQSGANATNLAAGTYDVTVTDDNGCTEELTITIAEPTALVLTEDTTTDVLCNGEDNGSASVSTNGGTGPYDYEWSNGDNGSTANNLPAGSHTVTVTDDNGCTEEISVLINEPPVLTLALDSSTDALCNGSDDGTASVSGGGGTAPYSYAWSNGSTGDSANDLPAGTHSVTLTDDNGCTESIDITVDEPAEVSLSEIANADASCFGIDDGSSTVQGSGGTAPYTYQWSSGQSTASVNDLAAGSYTITVTDANDCTTEISINIDEPEIVVLVEDNHTDALCFGSSDGTATVSSSGGSLPHSYAWSNGQSGSFASGLAAGTLTVTVTDANGCTNEIDVTIGEAAELLLDETNNLAANCNSSSDGSASVAGSGGTPPYTYQWSNGQTGASATNLAAGSYSVVVTDANGCTESVDVIIDEPTLVALSEDAHTDALCNGSSDGTASVSATGGTLPYSFDWSDGQSGDNVGGLPAGTFDVTVTDANGCTDEIAVIIAEPDILQATATSSDALCNGGDEGTATVSANGGTAPYSYDLGSGASASPNINGLVAGNYIITITDDHGCTATTSITIDEPQALQATATATPTLCNSSADGTASVSVNGGTAPFSYLWADGQSSITATGLPAGNISVVITDANGCTISADVNVDQPTAVDLAMSAESALCKDDPSGSASVIASGGTPPYSYLWSDAQLSATAEFLVAGNYTVTVTDANGCTEEADILVDDPELLIITNALVVEATCGEPNGSVDISVQGGTQPYSYSWSNQDTNEDPTALFPGNYSVTVTDANGCTATDTYNVTEPGALNMTNNPVDVSCNGGSDGSINLNVMGGNPPYAFIWNTTDTQEDLANLPAGSYSVTVSDGDGCTITESITLTEPEALSVLLDPSLASCGVANGSISLTVLGGTMPYSFSWDSGDVVEDPANLLAGSYSVVVTDANGCTITGAATILNPDSPELSFSSTDVNCHAGIDGTIDLLISGGSGQYTIDWSDDSWDGVANPNALAAGVYTVIVTDSDNCSATETITINEPAEALVIQELGIVEATCGNANGSVDIDVSGGTSPYTYNWSNGTTSQDVANLTPGVISVTVTDANDCKISQNFNVSEPDALQIDSAVPSDVLCNGGSDGSIEVSVMGGNPPYTYSWTSGQSTEDLSNLPMGDYQLTVTDADGCTVSISVTVNQPEALSASAVPTIASCGLADGSINLIVQGGTLPYSFSWDNGDIVEDPTNLLAGSYSVVATDANGCTISTSADIVNPNSPALSFSSTDVNCHGGIDGTINLDISGGSGQYTIDWSDDSWDGVANPNALAAGVYTVIVTDSDNCSATETVTINEPAEALAIQELGIVEATCGNANGSVDIDVSGGTSPYTYNWSNGTTSQDVANLTPGVISVTVTDANDCKSSQNFNVSEPDALQIDSAVPSDVLCNGGSDGSIEVSVMGGNPPYTYSWTSGQSTEDLSNLPMGDYQLTVTDADGCTVSISVTVNQPEALSASAVPTIASCGLADGSINLIVQGGTLPYSFSWDNGDIVEDPTNLLAGSYSVVVTDANGCTIASMAEVVNPNAPALSANATHVNCHAGADGSILLTITGGSGTYTIDWSDDSIDGQDNPNTLVAGTYSVTITDSDNCSTTETYVITEPEALMLNTDEIVEAVCGEPNGSVSVSVSGGTSPYSYLWSNGATTEDLANLFPGVYSLTITDANGCELIESFSVTEPDALQLSGQPSAVLCNGGDDGRIDVDVMGGTLPYEFSWSNGATTEDIDNLMAGSYSLTVTDADGCTFTFATEVTQPEAIETSSTFVEAICNEDNGSIDLTVTGGTQPYTFDWDNASDVEDPQNLFAGTYSVTITDANGCTAVHSETVTTPNGLAVSAQETDANCNGDANGEVDASVQGGLPPYTYQWSNGATTEDITNLPAGSYTLIVADSDGCTVSITATVNEPDLLISIADLPLGASCKGNSDGGASLSTSGGTAPYSYLWSNGSTHAELTNVPAGSYTVVITDAHGCTTTESVTIDEPELLVVTAQATDAMCHSSSDGSINASVTGGTTSNGQYTFEWSNGADPVEDPSALPAGVYVVTVTDDNGCTALTSVSIGQPSAISIMITDESDYNGFNLTCSDAADGYAEVSAQGGNPPYSYAWDNGSTLSSIEDVSAGTYIVTVTDANGCTEEQSLSLSAPLPIHVVAQAIPPQCKGDRNGIISLEPVTGGTAPFTYSLNGGPLETFPGWTNLGAGAYDILVEDANGCRWNTSLTIDDPAPIGVNLGGDVEIPLGDSLQLDPTFFNINTSTMSYQWLQGVFRDSSNVGLTPEIKPTTTSVYHLYVVDENGCSTYDIVTVFVRKERLVYIPNAFSPNDDGINDIFMIFAGKGVAEVKTLMIFDRWGETMMELRNFQPNDPDFGWDGFFRGDRLQPAVFVYFAEVEFEDGSTELYKGDLTLVR